MQRQRFDLHTHSTASDGMLPPRELVALAAERGLAGIALTDHDTVAGLAEAQGMAQALGIRCIAGIELACQSEHARELHLLGYCIDPTNVELGALIERMRRERMERAEAIADRLDAIVGGFTMEEVLAESAGAPPGRPHVARALMRRGFVASIDEAFTSDWIGPGGRAFVGRSALDVAEAIDVIHRAGGVAVCAHPGARSREAGGIREAAIRQAATHGLDGIEVDHPSHTDEVVARCVELAAELGLVATAGSDDHAQGPQGSRLGCRTVPGRIVDALEARSRLYRTGQ